MVGEGMKACVRGSRRCIIREKRIEKGSVENR